MSEHLWTTVDQYISDTMVAADPALDGALRASADAGLPAIAVSAAQGKFLHLLAHPRSAPDPGDRHARRLQHDLAGPGAARRRS